MDSASLPARQTTARSWGQVRLRVARRRAPRTARTRHPARAATRSRTRAEARLGCPGRHRPRTQPTGRWRAAPPARPRSRLLMGRAAATHPSPATDRDVPAMGRRRTRVPRVDPRTNEARGPRQANRGRPESRMVADPKDRSRARPGGYSAHAGMIANARNSVLPEVRQRKAGCRGRRAPLERGVAGST